jgi:hypothetical protein
MFLSSIVNRFLGGERGGFYCSFFQGVAGASGLVGGVLLKFSNRQLSTGLVGGSLVLLIQSIVQCKKTSNDSNFSLNCKRISCLTFATLFNGVMWAYVWSFPEEDKNQATAYAVASLALSEMIANAEDLKHFAQRCFCSERPMNTNIFPEEEFSEEHQL